jgi:hypothetical protein
MDGATLINAPKDTDSRCKKFLNWHAACVYEKIHGKAKNVDEKFHLKEY